MSRKNGAARLGVGLRALTILPAGAIRPARLDLPRLPLRLARRRAVDLFFLTDEQRADIGSRCAPDSGFRGSANLRAVCAPTFDGLSGARGPRTNDRERMDTSISRLSAVVVGEAIGELTGPGMRAGVGTTVTPARGEGCRSCALGSLFTRGDNSMFCLFIRTNPREPRGVVVGPESASLRADAGRDTVGTGRDLAETGRDLAETGRDRADAGGDVVNQSERSPILSATPAPASVSLGTGGASARWLRRSASRLCMANNRSMLLRQYSAMACSASDCPFTSWVSGRTRASADAASARVPNRPSRNAESMYCCSMTRMSCSAWAIESRRAASSSNPAATTFSAFSERGVRRRPRADRGSSLVGSSLRHTSLGARGAWRADVGRDELGDRGEGSARAASPESNSTGGTVQPIRGVTGRFLPCKSTVCGRADSSPGRRGLPPWYEDDDPRLARRAVEGLCGSRRAGLFVALARLKLLRSSRLMATFVVGL